ncbi:MAG: glycosyltransferase family 1 protein [Isosphaeraceae bacterium]|nr:glycosyltransferase family 1 protein [Isosphaeraceae bacterium]
MRIGFDGSCLANRRGFGRFTREMLTALAEAPRDHELVVFVDRPSAPHVNIPANCERVVVEVGEAPTKAASATGRRRLGDMLAMGRAVAGAKIDLMYFPATYSFFPIWGVKRVVVTMFDTLALAHPDLVFPTWQGRLAWKAKEYAAAFWSDRIVTSSETSRRDLIAWFRLPERKVALTTLGPDPLFGPREPGPVSDAALARYGVTPGTRFLLYVGGLSPHKNLARLIEAFAQSAPSDVTLVLVGDMGDVFHTHVPVLRETIARCELGERVHFTGFVPDEDLVYFYNRAVALVQPSLMEGFGLPPVEAMACGTPVLSSIAGSLPEVVGEAGMFFDPRDVGAIADALRRVFDDPAERTRLARIARRRAAEFTWAEGARRLFACFESLAPSAAPNRRVDSAHRPGVRPEADAADSFQGAKSTSEVASQG